MLDNKNKNPKQLLFLIVIAVVAIAYFVFQKTKSGPEISQKPDYSEWDRLTASDTCPGPVKPFFMNDTGLKGVIEKDTAIPVTLDYYKCNTPKVGDIVMVKGRGADPIVRIIQAVHGDVYDVVLDQMGRGWNIKINNKYLKAHNNEIYYFGVSKTPPPLKLYQNDRKSGILKPGEFLIFSTYPTSGRDSGVFGIYSTESLIGKVELQ